MKENLEIKTKIEKNRKVLNDELLYLENYLKRDTKIFTADERNIIKYGKILLHFTDNSKLQHCSFKQLKRKHISIMRAYKGIISLKEELNIGGVAC